MIRAVAGLSTAIVIMFAALTAALTAGPGRAASGFARPVIGARISQSFGCTAYASEPIAPRCPGGHWHTGIDLATAAGTPVMATLGGVATVLRDVSGYGLHVVLDHGQGLSSLYAHLQATTVGTGDAVIAGQVIGAVGSTGNSSGPHLHFEIRRDGIAEDPTLDLPLPW